MTPSTLPAQPARHQAPTPLWPLLLIGVLAGIALPLSAELGGAQDADGVLTALISTQKLTWYFWGQDRLLNFIPALAWPLTNPEWNLHFQLFLRALFAFLAPAGLIYFLTRSARVLTLGTVLANAVLGLTLGHEALFNLYVQHNPFGTSLVLFALGFVVQRGERGKTGRYITTAILLFLAYATNFALLVLSLPFLFLLLWQGDIKRSLLLRFLLINLLAIGAAYVHAKVFGESSTPLGSHATLKLIRAGYVAVSHQMAWTWIAALATGSILAGLLWRLPNTRTAILLMLGCLALVGVMSSSRWVQANGYNIRYYLIFVIGVVSASSFLLTSALDKFTRHQGVYIAATLALLGFPWFFSLHGLSATPGALIQVNWREPAKVTAQLVSSERVQFVVGNFWDVWPTVFEANSLPAEKRHGLTIYGGAERGKAVREQIWRSAREHGGLRSLCFGDDANVCADQASEELRAALVVAPGDVRRFEIDGRPLLVFDMRLADTGDAIPSAKGWGQKVLAATEAKAEVTVTQIHYAPAQKKVIVTVQFRNDGPATMTPYGAHSIGLGVRLAAADGAVEKDYARLPVPFLRPSETALIKVKLDATALDGHGLSMLPVQEAVAWFDAYGMSPTTLPPFHACTKDGVSWMCDAQGPLPELQEPSPIPLKTHS